MTRGAYEAPKDYAEVWIEFYAPTMRWVRKQGVPENEVEDVAQDVLAKFIAKDGLAYYDPHKVFDTGVHTQRIPGARLRRATFAGYMRNFVNVYCLNYRDKAVRVVTREGTFRLDAPVAADSSLTWADALVSDGSMEDAAVTGADCAAVIHIGKARMKTRDERRAVLEAVPSSRLRKRPWTLEAGFEAVSASMAQFGVLDRAWLGERLGLTPSQVSTMLVEMREVLRESGAGEALNG